MRKRLTVGFVRRRIHHLLGLTLVWLFKPAGCSITQAELDRVIEEAAHQ